MEIMHLRDKELPPSKELFIKALGKNYPVFEEFMDMITTTNIGLTPQWNYYNDGKAWLCKVIFKKKTVFWLSVWENFFKAVFYYTEKNKSGIFDLQIDPQIITDFKEHKPVGKFLPLVMKIEKKEQLFDLLKIIDYKKSLK